MNLLIAIFAAGFVSAADPLPSAGPSADAFIGILREGRWSLEALRPVLPPLEKAASNKSLLGEECEDCVERAYDAGGLRLFGNERGDVFAVVLENGHPWYERIARLPASKSFDLYVREPEIILLPTRPVDAATFEALKRLPANSAKDYERRLGAPSYRIFVHGGGGNGIEYVAPRLMFIAADDGSALYVCSEKSRPELSYAAYLGCLHRSGERWADLIHQERTGVREALAKGSSSPDGRFTLAPWYYGVAQYQRLLLIQEKGSPERRVRSHLAFSPSYLWLDAEHVIGYEQDVENNADLYLLDLRSVGEKKLLRIPPDPLHHWPIALGKVSDHRFWYDLGDGAHHEADVSK